MRTSAANRLKKLWDRFGPYVIGLAILIVVATAGYRGWIYWQEKQAQATGDRFLAALNLANQGKHDEAITALKAIEANGSGSYPVLAEFRVASEMAATGKTQDAIAEYDAIAAKSGNVQRGEGACPAARRGAAGRYRQPWPTSRSASTTSPPPAMCGATTPANCSAWRLGGSATTRRPASISTRSTTIRKRRLTCASVPR